MAKKNGNGNTIKVNMIVEKETKNTFRYKEVLKNEYDRPTLQTLYLPKDICKGAEKLTVTVELR